MKRKLVLSPNGEPQVVPMPEELNPISILWYEDEDEIYDQKTEDLYKPVTEWIADYISNHENVIISTVANVVESGYEWTAQQTYFECTVSDESYKEHIRAYFDEPEYKVFAMVKILVDIPHWVPGDEPLQYRGIDSFQLLLYRQIPSGTNSKIDFISRKLHINLLLDDLA